jgi:hypothetical protein
LSDADFHGLRKATRQRVAAKGKTEQITAVVRVMSVLESGLSRVDDRARIRICESIVSGAVINRVWV